MSRSKWSGGKRPRCFRRQEAARPLRGQKNRDIFYQNSRQHWAASRADTNWLLSRSRNSGTKLFNGSAVLTESARDRRIAVRGIHIWRCFARRKGEISVGSTGRWRGRFAIRLVLDKKILSSFSLSLLLSNKSNVGRSAESDQRLRAVNFDAAIFRIEGQKAV